MIGAMIEKARKDKKMTKAELSNLTGIDIGHLTHIEKGERTPSHKALKKICQVLGIPFQPILYTYDRSLPKKHYDYNPVQYVSYDRIPVFDSIADFAPCPATHPSAAFAIKMTDSKMESWFDMNTYVYVERNTSLSPGEIGLFYYNGSIVIRQFYLRESTVILTTDSGKASDITVRKNDEFYIIGKIIR